MEGDASISTVGDGRIWATRQDNGHGVGLGGEEEEEGTAKGLVVFIKAQFHVTWKRLVLS